MNERIIEMAIEAGFNPVNCTGSNVPLFEKFAELIVRECDLYARQNWEHGLLLGGDLKRHFGIEE